MISALSLLRKAVRLLTDDPLLTVRVVAPCVALMTAVGGVAVVAVPDLLRIRPGDVDLTVMGSGLLPGVLVGTFALSYALMAIAWHRHTLRDSHGARPLSLSLMGGYLWRVLLLAAVQLAVGLVLVVPLALSGHAGGDAGGPALFSMAATTLAAQLVLLWLSLRLSLILPAAALGRPLTMRSSWGHTTQLARPLWGVAAALAALNMLFAGLLATLGLTQPAQIAAVELPACILEGMLIFSIVTVLYSVSVQGQTPGQSSRQIA